MTPLVFFRRQLELALTFFPENEIPHYEMVALIGVLESPLHDLRDRAHEWDEDQYYRCFVWHLERLEDVLEGFSDHDEYSHSRPDRQADNFRILARIMREEVGNCFERLRWEAMPDYGFELLFGTDRE